MTQFRTEQLNYTSHIQTDALLDSQKLISPHPEEMLFVIIHQVYELCPGWPTGHRLHFDLALSSFNGLSGLADIG